MNFTDFGLHVPLLKAVTELGFEQPTPIQEKIIPQILNANTDLIGLAQTGTGKTAAFGLPLIHQIDLQQKKTQVLVLAPTRELCVQISKDLQYFARYITDLKVVPVYGGENIDKQLKALKNKPQIITATPGRMLDLINRKAISISNLHTAVLDEADEMLNMGFREELDHILAKTPRDKRTVLFSATMPNEVEHIAQNYMNRPEKITVTTKNAGADNIRHLYYQIHERDRYIALKRIADNNPDIYGIVFCRTKQETKEVAEKLIKDGYNCDALHGDLSQAQRDHVMTRFRNRSLQMLVATDVAARGIDVQDISHIINYNLPEDLDVYTHRSGRTGRAYNSGVCMSLINYREVSKISSIEKMIRKKLEKMPVPDGNEICKKQIFKLINELEQTEVREEQIAPFMETINTKLEAMSKEQLIKHFVSMEFNRMLTYYKDAPDLNQNAGKEAAKDKNNKQNNKQNTKRPNNKKAYTRFFMNKGKKDGIRPHNIIGMINEQTQNRDIRFGDIDIRDSFSFFEADTEYTSLITEAFDKGKGNVKVEIAKPANGNNKKKKTKKREPQSEKN